ncbi:protein-L-isoaspartate(D-aspartate) O-methyltransferase [Halorubrum aidingense JCM 13560]|uniref:protein-L-isoaspartate(D-aspartate) O-methyltransferase n=1 Tax=Halorubrum aidingense JCM 13560 TaxID=1230454 RepID=M0P4V0_9EURY|nr:methyltransferase domain-containing protein [Halorubrum aidingense]EMA65172.1 protein-L-isoaspartate(D-aspartate) O-methyltransferase [Halorubrum aidingense JCM 13560]
MDEASLRADMIEGLEHQIGEPLGASVLTALKRVPRDAFVDDAPYATGASSEADARALAPAIVVRLLTALAADEGDEVLVVGAGVGYSVAMLAEIAGARHVHAVDIDREAVSTARSNLSAAGYDAVLVDRRDGANGLPEYAPYDRILLEAAVVEPPRALREQLADGGRIVYPRGTTTQTIAAIESDTVESPATGVDSPPDEAPPGFVTVETAGPVGLRPMLVDGEQAGVERNRTRREDAERAEQGHFAKHGWEQEWIDWDDRL